MEAPQLHPSWHLHDFQRGDLIRVTDTGQWWTFNGLEWIAVSGAEAILMRLYKTLDRWQQGDDEIRKACAQEIRAHVGDVAAWEGRA